MAKVNREALQQALNDLTESGVIIGWQARPLNMGSSGMNVGDPMG